MKSAAPPVHCKKTVAAALANFGWRSSMPYFFRRQRHE